MRIVAVKDVTFGYHHTSVVDNVSFEIDKGQFVGITGQNGASKSTVLKIILGLLTPWSGEVEIKKVNGKKEPLHIGYVPQQIASFNIGFPSTVIELVRSGRFNKKKWFQKLNSEDHEVIKNALECGNIDMRKLEHYQEDKNKKFVSLVH